ncbi:MAG TPA: hypothetical protein VFC19_51410 [Candidatus Limnocylindrales bacterium]|nr:hypothetical protein [Candidatus Limnocylindrales bacterium]
MNLLWLIRFGAACGVVLGLSLGVPGIVEAFTGETTVTSFIVGLGVAFGLPALTALYLRLPATGRLERFAYAANVIGLGLFAGVAFSLNLVLFFLEPAVAEAVLAGPTRYATLFSAAFFVLGTAGFGACLIRSRAFPTIAGWAYTVALPLLAVLAPLPDTPLISAIHVIAGGSVIWLAASLWSPRSEPRSERPTGRLASQP